MSSIESDDNIHIGKEWTAIDGLSTTQTFDKVKGEFSQDVAMSVLLGL